MSQFELDRAFIVKEIVDNKTWREHKAKKWVTKCLTPYIEMKHTRRYIAERTVLR